MTGETVPFGSRGGSRPATTKLDVVGGSLLVSPRLTTLSVVGLLNAVLPATS